MSLAPLLSLQDSIRFWSQIAIGTIPPKHSTPCLLWTGLLNRNGYGWVYLRGRREMAHKIAWLDSRKPLYIGLVLDHTCCVRNCVLHVEPVTVAENNRRKLERNAQQ